jgi:hypothetical protein
MLKYVLPFCVIATTAFAGDEPRKIDFTSVIMDQDDQPLRECTDDPLPKEIRECKAYKSVTLGMIAFRALASAERDVPQDESVRRGHLGLTIYKAAAAQLTAEEITLIKKQIAKNYSPLVVVRAFGILDPAEKAKP